jgi:hypothetical protein
MSVFSPSKNLEEPANGADPGTWDVPVNSNFNIIDAAFGGNVTINCGGASGTVNLATAQYQPPNINLTGAPAANVTYQFPASVGWNGSVNNSTTGNTTVTFASAGGGRTTVVQRGYRTALTCDAINVDQQQNTPGNPGGNTTQIQFNLAGTLSGSNLLIWDGGNLTAPALKLTGSSSGYLGFQPPATVTTPLIWTLPNGDGTAGQFLSTQGNGTLAWATGGGGGGAGVTSFNGRQGAVSLTSSDVNSAVGYTVGYIGLPSTSQANNYTSVLADQGTDQFFTASGKVWTINASLSYPNGTVMSGTILSGTLTVSLSTGTFTFSPSGGTGSRTVTGPGYLIARLTPGGWMCFGLGAT